MQQCKATPPLPWKITQTVARPPLGVRIIAGVLIVSGVHSLLSQVLDLWFRTTLNWNIAFLLLPLGWALLRKREWARVTCVIFSLLGAIPLAVGLPAWFSIRLGIHANGGWQSGNGLYHNLQISVICIGAIVTLIWVFRTLELGSTRQWFQNSAQRLPLMVWNPLKWQFSVSVLLLITAMVAITTFQLAFHPSLPRIRGMRWAESQDWNDPIYFPAGVQYWPQVANSSGRIGISLPDEMRFELDYVTRAPEGWNDEPSLIYVVFGEGTQYSSWPPPWRVIEKDSQSHQYELLVNEVPALTLPEDAQIIEIVDGSIQTSALRITLLELSSYMNSAAMFGNDSDRSLDHLENFIKDLRRRVAQRDAEKK